MLRLADSADPGWTATLDGKPLTRTTVDGWAQGFELPSGGGRLDVTFDAPLSHTAWLWAQGALAAGPRGARPAGPPPRRRRRPARGAARARPGRHGRRPPRPPPAGPGGGGGRGVRRGRRRRVRPRGEPGRRRPAPAVRTATGTPRATRARSTAPGRAGYEGAGEYADGGHQQPYQPDAYQGAAVRPYAYGGTTPYDPAYEQDHGANGTSYDAHGRGYGTDGQGYDPGYGTDGQGYDPAATARATTSRPLRRPGLRPHAAPAARHRQRAPRREPAVNRTHPVPDRRRRPRSPPSPVRRPPGAGRTRGRRRDGPPPGSPWSAPACCAPQPSTSDLADTAYTSFTPASRAPARRQGRTAGGHRDVGRRQRRGGGKPAGTPRRPKEPGKPATGDASGSEAPALVGTAEGRLAPGWTVQQTTDVAAGTGRGLLGTNCTAPDTEFWFPGASTAEDRTDYVHLTNPDDSAAVVDIELYGKDGALKSTVADGHHGPAARLRADPAVHAGRRHGRPTSPST